MIVVATIFITAVTAGFIIGAASRADATLWGASYARTVHPDEHRWAGRSPVVRVFDGGSLGEWGDYPALTRAYGDGTRKFHVSWKGTSSQDVRDFAATIPTGVKMFGTWMHEPEDNIEAGRLTLADWRATTIRLAAVMREEGVIPVRVLMGWTLLPESARDVRDYDLPPGTITISAFDAHVRANGKNPAVMASLLLKEKARTGLPLAIPETSGPPRRINILQRGLAGGARWACWFGPVGMTDAQARAWFG
jgi:hypothetical protein